jgi:hypothetical protein
MSNECPMPNDKNKINIFSAGFAISALKVIYVEEF